MLLTVCGWSLHLGEENVVDLPNVAFAVSGILYDGSNATPGSLQGNDSCKTGIFGLAYY